LFRWIIECVSLNQLNFNLAIEQVDVGKDGMTIGCRLVLCFYAQPIPSLVSVSCINTGIRGPFFAWSSVMRISP
jgi:hypothetical protein